MHLLKYFDTLSLRPENAKEIRALILELAIRGRLTEEWRRENPDVEPASVLLERIREEKVRLVREKVIRKEKKLQEIEQADYPFKLPKSWSWCYLRDTGITQTGYTPSKRNPEFWGNYIPFVNPANIKFSGVELPEIGLTKAGLSNGRLIQSGSLMMVCIGGSIGKCGVNTIDVSCNQQINTLTPIEVLSDVVKNVCATHYFYKSIIDRATGSATPIINKTKWESTLFPLPPLPEQHAIVATVNRLLAEVDELEQQTTRFRALRQDYVTASLRQLTGDDSSGAWAALRPHFQAFFDQQNGVDRLREAVLELAVQGKLTARWREEHPEVEPASVLLERIGEEKARLVREGFIKKIKKPPLIEPKETSFNIPKSWKWCRLADATEVITKGSSPKWQGVSYVNEGEGILFVTSENVGNFKLIWKRRKYVEEKFNQIEPRSILRKGDILMNIVGASIGRTAVFNLDIVANINQAVTIIRLIEQASREYFLLFLNSPTCISYMYDKQVDNARPNLSMGNISKFLIPLPPLSEQRAIVKIVDELMALCDQLQERIEQREVVGADFLRASVRELLAATEKVEA
ncbi:hypothetical protein FUA23_07160 [Neolewinella aurantiaca]|uniref:Type I restriction modification DNA specificity domain-containing protein n=1 Tax=Neolewinella aurantiaca TaxID=2602767 RepID=A0A5C7FK90_9BACT|nr:restriction endonuclease subunit S [Neolewinella aurantiaca]TXF90291.1 hypothetical protein FUA23_07160 [Neolewinella aurantiaca]